MADRLERAIYSVIASHDGIKAKDIGKYVDADRHTINVYLYRSPFMRELCYRDRDFLWHGLIRQTRPHRGLQDFCGYYSTVREFLSLSEEEWFRALLDGCRRIGRNLNDTRGLFHSFRDARETMVRLFSDLSELQGGEASAPDDGSRAAYAAPGVSSAGRSIVPDGHELSHAGRSIVPDDWEIVFELRIDRAKYIRIYADVLVITEDKVFSLEFKMKDKPVPEEVSQAGKYAGFLEVIFGPRYDVIAALVLTRAEDLYRYVPVGNAGAELPVCSGDMLFNLFDEYLGFLTPS